MAGLAGTKFEAQRSFIVDRLLELGYETRLLMLNANEFGLPQHRQRMFIVGRNTQYTAPFDVPGGIPLGATVGSLLHDLMAANGWPHADAWAVAACWVEARRR